MQAAAKLRSRLEHETEVAANGRVLSRVFALLERVTEHAMALLPTSLPRLACSISHSICRMTH